MENYHMENDHKSSGQTVYFHLKCSMLTENPKNNITGSNDLIAHHSMVVLDLQKARLSCQTYVPEKNEEKAHFDEHSVGFLAFKNATKMADIHASGPPKHGFGLL